MSSKDVAVSVRGLSKSYTIAHNAEKHTTAAEALMHRLKNPFQKVEKETFWALRDVEFDIQKGDVVGIIGRNGAGKSTLLKILSRITEPTTGQIDLYGRVGSLLEVGTGFHPELTGRENIFLNGAILGMSKREIARQFDAIVDFSGTEQFLDTPVKRYSSGMYVRLAFAVAAHLNPEILIVDEVLAVGDAEFQKKCLGKMQDVSQQDGKTVLFVSHNFEAVKTLCRRGVLLHKGRVIADDKPTVCIEKLLAEMRGMSSDSFRVEHHSQTEAGVLPEAVQVTARGKSEDEFIEFDDDIIVSLRLDMPLQENYTFAMQILNSSGITIFNTFYSDHADNPPLKPGKTREICVKIPPRLLPSGVYEAVFAYMLPGAQLRWITRDTWFEVHEIESYRNEGLTQKRTGLISLMLPWENC